MPFVFIKVINDCCVLTVCVPLKLLNSNLIPRVVVFGGEAFGRRLGQEDSILMNWISVLLTVAQGNLFMPSAI